MPLTLILMRHAKSDWAAGLRDHERPLNDRGRRAAPLMAAWLRDGGFAPARALVSSAVRTQETWERMGLDAPSETRPGLYEAEGEAILAEIAATVGAPAPLLVLGHNPGMQEAANRLLAEGDLPDFPTAQCAVFGFGIEDWAALRFGSGRLLSVAWPKGLV